MLSPEETLDLVRLLDREEENWSRRDRLRYNEIMAKVDRGAVARCVHQQ